MSYYFVKVPKLPQSISHQNRMVELVEYAVEEHDKLDAGQPVAIVQNRWARMVLKSVGAGYVSKVFFQRGTLINEGDPLAIIVCDPEEGPPAGETCVLEILERLREKP